MVDLVHRIPTLRQNKVLNVAYGTEKRLAPIFLSTLFIPASLTIKDGGREAQHMPFVSIKGNTTALSILFFFKHRNTFVLFR